MKTILATLSIALWLANPWANADIASGVAVPTTAIKIVGASGMKTFQSWPTWATNVVYTNGMYVKSNGGLYMCLVGGTSSNAVGGAPSGAYTDLSDGPTVKWRPCLSTPRKGLYIHNLGTNGFLFVGPDRSIVANKGSAVNPNNGVFSVDHDVPKGEIWAIQSTVTGTVTTLEW